MAKKPLIPALPASAIPTEGYVLMSGSLEPFVLGILSIFKVSRPTLYAAIADGRLPHPVTVGVFNAWPSLQIKALIADWEAGQK